MNKIIRNIFIAGMGVMTVTSCSDAMDEITSIVFDRVFAPVDLEAKSVSQESANIEWNPSKGAGTYTIEVYENDSLTFAGTPVQTFSGLTDEDIPYRLTGLVYDTKYSVRVMALDTEDEERNSKWSGVYFRTSAQQIFEDVPEGSIGDRTVTMTWPAGETVTKVTVLDATTGAQVVTRDLTPAEIEAGEAIVSGLTPETRYTIKLYNGDKERGSKTLTTIADLNGAILVGPDDDFKAVIADAADGAVLALTGGTFTIAGEADGAGCAILDKNITIKGIYPTNLPVINGRFQIDNGAAVSLSQLILDGSENESGDQTFVFKTAGVTYGALDVQDCEIRNYEKGVFYLNVASTVQSITLNNCLIHDIECSGGDMFDSRTGSYGEFNLTNSTVYASCAARDFVRMDDASSTFGGAPVINVLNCTIDGASNASGKRLLYVRYAGNVINWKNNLVTNTVAVFSNQSKTSVPTFQNNTYYNTNNLKVVNLETKSNMFTDESANWDQNPQYKDAANGDFTIGNEDVSKLGVGDPRWLQ